MTDAKKVRYDRTAAIELAKKARTLVAGRGKTAVSFDMRNPTPDEELAALILGPTGNLKAPTLLIGKTLVVGFNEEAYKRLLSQ